MRPLLFGVILGVLLLWPAALSLAATTVAAAAHPAVLAFVLGVLLRPLIVRRTRRWTS